MDSRPEMPTVDVGALRIPPPPPLRTWKCAKGHTWTLRATSWYFLFFTDQSDPPQKIGISCCPFCLVAFIKEHVPDSEPQAVTEEIGPDMTRTMAVTPGEGEPSV